MEKQVVIIGAGLTGTAISHYLVEQNIAHLLIGDAPNTMPKLGESINPEGTTELINKFRKYNDCFYEKKLTIVGVGKYKIHCNFSAIGRQKFVKAALGFISPGLKVPEEMIHIDRARLDRNMFEDIKDHPLVTHLPQKVTHIAFNKETDAIDALTLDDGRIIETSHVFDATNHLRLVGKATEQKITKLSSLQQVTFCHYYNDDFDPMEQTAWEHSTNLLKLSKDVDGFDGFAWCIPLDSYVSVGVSRDAEGAKEEGLSPEQTMELARAAYLRRGLDFRKSFTRANKAVSIFNQYFTHERAYGANWLLAGPSYNQIWYMSGSGVACSLTAAYMAGKFIKNPKKVGAAYQEYVDRYINTHNTIDWFVKTDVDKMSENKFLQMTYQWLMSNMNRMSRYPLLRGKALASICSKVMSFFMDSKLLSEKHFSFNKFCPAGEVVSYQDVWRPSSMTLRQVQVQREEIIKTLFSIISNKKEINEVDKIMSPKVNLWMDNKPFWGRRFWKIWVLYLQNYKGFKDLTLSAEQLSHSEGQVNVIARWSAEKNGELAKSNDVIGTCYFKNEKLVRIESKAINYTFILGDNFKYSLNFLLRMPVILLWYVRNIKLHYPQRLPRW